MKNHSKKNNLLTTEILKSKILIYQNPVDVTFI